MKYVHKTVLEGTFFVRAKFSYVRSSDDLCAHAQLSLRGTIASNTFGCSSKVETD